MAAVVASNSRTALFTRGRDPAAPKPHPLRRASSFQKRARVARAWAPPVDGNAATSAGSTGRGHVDASNVSGLVPASSRIVATKRNSAARSPTSVPASTDTFCRRARPLTRIATAVATAIAAPSATAPVGMLCRNAAARRHRYDSDPVRRDQSDPNGARGRPATSPRDRRLRSG